MVSLKNGKKPSLGSPSTGGELDTPISPTVKFKNQPLSISNGGVGWGCVGRGGPRRESARSYGPGQWARVFQQPREGGCRTGRQKNSRRGQGGGVKGNSCTERASQPLSKSQPPFLKKLNQPKNQGVHLGGVKPLGPGRRSRGDQKPSSGPANQPALRNLKGIYGTAGRGQERRWSGKPRPNDDQKEIRKKGLPLTSTGEW